MGLKDFIFGKKLILTDPFLGTITSSRTKSKAAKSLSWDFKHQISSFKTETYIIVEGDYLGINQTSRKTLMDFISNFENYYSTEIENLISKLDKKEEIRNWKNDCYPSFIHPISVDTPSSFQIYFTKYNEDDEKFMLELNDNKLEKLEVFFLKIILKHNTTLEYITEKNANLINCSYYLSKKQVKKWHFKRNKRHLDNKCLKVGIVELI